MFKILYNCLINYLELMLLFNSEIIINLSLINYKCTIH